MIESIESIPMGSGHSAQEYLAAHPDEYFFCEREKCIMRKTTCLQYQQQSEERITCDHGVRFFGGKSLKACERANCWDCEQGKRIKEEMAPVKSPSGRGSQASQFHGASAKIL